MPGRTVAGRDGSFTHTFEFRDEADREALNSAPNVFEWLKETDRLYEKSTLIRRTIFPFLLSDFLDFVYESLENSRHGRLSVAYALLRKPLQENLFLTEAIVADVDKFSTHFSESPSLLRSQKAGGIEVHEKIISRVLQRLQEEKRFDAKYLAQLRYQKDEEDSFDSACNLATHLITDHKSIRTAPYNLNFIFSGPDDKLSQWYYFYSRLPYILFYVRRLWEHVYASFQATDPVYLADIERQITAATLLWAPAVSTDYQYPAMEPFVKFCRDWLIEECQANGHPEPKEKDLFRMSLSGAWPREPGIRALLRSARYFFVDFAAKT